MKATPDVATGGQSRAEQSVTLLASPPAAAWNTAGLLFCKHTLLVHVHQDPKLRSFHLLPILKNESNVSVIL